MDKFPEEFIDEVTKELWDGYMEHKGNYPIGVEVNKPPYLFFFLIKPTVIPIVNELEIFKPGSDLPVVCMNFTLAHEHLRQIAKEMLTCLKPELFFSTIDSGFRKQEDIQYYFLFVYAGVSISLEGPYSTREEMEAVVKDFYKHQDPQRDSIFHMKIVKGKPEVGEFPNGFFGEE